MDKPCFRWNLSEHLRHDEITWKRLMKIWDSVYIWKAPSQFPTFNMHPTTTKIYECLQNFTILYCVIDHSFTILRGNIFYKNLIWKNVYAQFLRKFLTEFEKNKHFGMFLNDLIISKWPGSFNSTQIWLCRRKLKQLFILI